MDTLPKLKRLLFVLLCFLYPSISFATLGSGVGEINLAGWIKGADGVYSRAFSDGNGTRAMPTNATVNSTSTALVQTSKGITAIDIVKTANVNTARLGSAMIGLAKKAGPLGMTLTAASLVCELTEICNQAGKWMMNPPASPTAPNSYPATDGKYWGWGTTYYPTIQGACSDSARLAANVGTSSSFTFDHSVDLGGGQYACFVKRASDGQVFAASNTNKVSGCAPGYTLTGSNCLKNGVVPVEATNTDLDNAASKLNDDRVTPHLIDAGEDVPTGVPTITNTPKQVISEDTAVTKDQNGNATGTKVTTTEAEIVDAATAESPGKAIVKETTTVTNYDINNTVINSTTSTSYTSQPPPNNPADQITISFDDVPDDGVEHEDVDTELETPQSWGDGFCPADETIDYHYGTLTFDFQPTCNFAIGVRPVLIFMASVTALFIVAGVKVE